MTISPIWKPSPNFTPANDPKWGRVDTSILVIHATAGLMPGTLSWLTNLKSGVSCHYLITKKGEIYQLVKDEDVAWHAGKSEWRGFIISKRRLVDMYKVDVNRLVGKTYNNLTIVSYAYSKNGKGYWNCVCSCGNTTVLQTTHITRGAIKSCGCLRSAAASALGYNRRLDYGETSFNALYSNYKNRAERKNYQFTLSKDQFRILTSADCFYCGASPELIVKVKNSTGEYKYNGVDRVDSGAGYTINNCVTSCTTCNTAKLAMGYAEFINWIIRVYGNVQKNKLYEFDRIQKQLNERDNETNNT